MAESILKDQKRILPCAAYCDKEYGVGGYYVGVPVLLGAGGVEKVVEIQMSADEKARFDKSVEAVKVLVKELKV
jgi:malate dehydrogenase